MALRQAIYYLIENIRRLLQFFSFILSANFPISVLFSQPRSNQSSQDKTDDEFCEIEPSISRFVLTSQDPMFVRFATLAHEPVANLKMAETRLEKQAHCLW